MIHKVLAKNNRQYSLSCFMVSVIITLNIRKQKTLKSYPLFLLLYHFAYQGSTAIFSDMYKVDSICII